MRRILEDVDKSEVRDKILSFIRNHNHKLVAIPEELTID